MKWKEEFDKVINDVCGESIPDKKSSHENEDFWKDVYIKEKENLKEKLTYLHSKEKEYYDHRYTYPYNHRNTEGYYAKVYNHRNVEEMFKCGDCGSTFELHIRSPRWSSPDFMFDENLEELTRLNSSIRVERSHYFCPICGGKWVTMGYLKNMRIITEG